MSPSGSGWFSCACGCSVGRQQRAESSPSISAIRKRSFQCWKYLVLGALVSALFQTLDRSFPWGTAGMGCSFLSWC